jgi:hypothetical protein
VTPGPDTISQRFLPGCPVGVGRATGGERGDGKQVLICQNDRTMTPWTRRVGLAGGVWWITTPGLLIPSNPIVFSEAVRNNRLMLTT